MAESAETSGSYVSSGIIVTANFSQVLVVRNESHPSHNKMYKLPGGTGEKRENPEETLIREFHEEVGIMPTRYCLVLKIERKGRGFYCHYFFIITNWSGSIKSVSTYHDDGTIEVGSPEWMDMDIVFDQRVFARSHARGVVAGLREYAKTAPDAVFVLQRHSLLEHD